MLSDELGAARVSRAGGGSQATAAEAKGETALQTASKTRYNRRKTFSNVGLCVPLIAGRCSLAAVQKFRSLPVEDPCGCWSSRPMLSAGRSCF